MDKEHEEIKELIKLRKERKTMSEIKVKIQCLH